MKVAWATMVGDARGKTGTIVATLTRSGPMMRALGTQLRKNSEAQILQRMAFATLSQLWKSTAMAAYRVGWINLALAHSELDVFNAPIFKTGSQWFIRCNRNRQAFDLNPVLTAPAFAAVGNTGTLTVAEDASPPTTITVSATTPPAAGESVVIKATKGISPGRLCISNQQKTIYTQNPGSGSSWEICTEYTTKFGTPIVGLQVFFQVYYVNVAQGRAGLTGTTSLVI